MAGRNLFADQGGSSKGNGRNLFEKQETTIAQDIDAGLRKIPGTQSLAELASGVNRSVVDFADFLTTEQINSILEISGSEKRVSPLRSRVPFVESGPLDPGLQKDVIGRAGEVIPLALGTGLGLSRAATALPTAAQGESALIGVARELGKFAPVQETFLGGVSGGGEAFGEAVAGDGGGVAGSILAPLAAVSAPKLIGGALTQGAKGIQNLTTELSQLSDDGAATLLAEQMIREGLTPLDVSRQLTELGPDAVPADLGNNFSRLLRAAANKVPSVEARSAETLNTRQAAQNQRIETSLDDATGTSQLEVGDEITRLNQSLAPQINDLYTQARSQGLRLSDRLRSLLEGDSDVGIARRAAETTLENKRAGGDDISNIDIIDATKQKLDDQINVAIRAGENNKVRDLVRVKKTMIDEVDQSIPEYKRARDLFAGKASLENAAESGENYFKLKGREIEDLNETLSASEKRMFKLGAKRAILDKIDTIQENADLTRLFTKNGDVRKLRGLFDDDVSYNRFADAFQREARFALTRRTAQANSTTTKQIADIGNAKQALEIAGTSLTDPIAGSAQFGRILFGLSAKKEDEVFTKSLEKAGDLLLASGMEQDKLLGILQRANRDEIRKSLESVMTQVSSDIVAPTAKASVSAALEGIQE
jgi:hypothetical protein